MYGLALGESAVELAAEVRLGQIVQHEQAAQQLAEQGAAFMNRQPLSSGAMATDQLGGRGMARLERGDEVEPPIPSSRDVRSKPKSLAHAIAKWV